jgi:hypothetical protein
MPAPINTSLGCNFCGIPGHIERHCRNFKAARAKARALNTTSINSQSSTSPSSGHQCSHVALSASLRRANTSESPPDLSWIAGTGATSHMTPHQQWFTDYKPHCIPIHVVNNAVVYSEGIGAVVIEPSDQSLFIDDASCHCWIYVLQKKSNTFDAFKQFKTLDETQYNGVIRFFRQDKGGQFIGNIWDEFFAEHGIRRENTFTATPQQNGVAERKNRILAELVTALLNESKLPKSFWAESLRTVNRALNMLPSSALPPDTTPFEIIEKCKPD